MWSGHSLLTLAPELLGADLQLLRIELRSFWFSPLGLSLSHGFKEERLCSIWLLAFQAQ